MDPPWTPCAAPRGWVFGAARCTAHDDCENARGRDADAPLWELGGGRAACVRRRKGHHRCWHCRRRQRVTSRGGAASGCDRGPARPPRDRHGDRPRGRRGALPLPVGGFAFRLRVRAVQNLGDAPFFANGDAATSTRPLYFGFATVTTVGYGDCTARMNLGHTQWGDRGAAWKSVSRGRAFDRLTSETTQPA